ncbi:MAG: heme NO-binding domain-containing protein [Kiloniellales bacterium]|nr:heme NO-binding domain-containing protein [Kiloniellales bacterium]
MKGVVFTEFMNLVDAKFSPAVTEAVVEKAELPNGGAYTAVGTYDVAEMVRLVGCLSDETGLPAADLLYEFGRHLLWRFAALYPQYFEEAGSVFAFLDDIEDKIHVDVRKLYADTELPRFETAYPAADQMTLRYSSPRGLVKVCAGLIDATIEQFEESIEVELDLIKEDGTEALFTLKKVPQ